MGSRIVEWVRTRRGVGAAAVGLTLVVAGTAVAGNGRLANLQLGIANTINGYVTTLTGSLANGRMLQVTNTNTTSTAGGLGVITKGGPGISVTVPTGRAPIAVNATAGKATNLNADKLDGLDQSAFLRATGKAADADKLDGFEATGFVRGNATAGAHAEAVPAGSSRSFWISSTPENGWSTHEHEITYQCSSTSATNGTLTFRNGAGVSVTVFSDNGLADPEYRQLAGDSSFSQPAFHDGELITIAYHHIGSMGTVSIFIKHRSNPSTGGPLDCHIQAHWVVNTF